MTVKRAVSSAIAWRAIDDAARDGRARLVRRDNDMAVARFDGERFVFPATGGRPLDFERTEYQP